MLLETKLFFTMTSSCVPHSYKHTCIILLSVPIPCTIPYKVVSQLLLRCQGTLKQPEVELSHLKGKLIKQLMEDFFSYLISFSYGLFPVPTESNYYPPLHSCLQSKFVHSFVNSLTMNLPINQILLTSFSYRALRKENLNQSTALGGSGLRG